VVGGYFEEWSIYFAGFNIANLQANGVADKLTHRSYAFGNATPTGCAIADPWADFQSPFLPSVSGAPYTGPLFGNFAALQQLLGCNCFRWRTASTFSSTGILGAPRGPETSNRKEIAAGRHDSRQHTTSNSNHRLLCRLRVTS
jgi:hypothetical protein